MTPFVVNTSPLHQGFCRDNGVIMMAAANPGDSSRGDFLKTAAAVAAFTVVAAAPEARAEQILAAK